MKLLFFLLLPGVKMLKKEEIARYNRHLLLPEIGLAGQERLKKAKVLVIGAGGLGCPVLLYLTAAGVGEIGIIDFDTIDESNLQRQVLFSVGDVGRNKAEVAAGKLSEQNPFVKFRVYNYSLNVKNALEVIKDFDIIVDGTDNFPARYLVNDACFILEKPLVYGSIYRFEGQVSVFNCTNKEGGRGPTYRCLFPEPPAPGSSPNCSAIGVLGVLPGIIGTIQANEVIKLITGAGETLSGKLLMINALTMDFNTMEIERNADAAEYTPSDSEEFLKMDYDFFCGTVQEKEGGKSITAGELIRLLDNNEALQLVDVREPGELPEAELNALNIPLAGIADQVSKISRNKKVIVYCRSGARSRRAIDLLEKEFGFSNLYNLEGGILAWLTNTTYKT